MAEIKLKVSDQLKKELGKIELERSIEDWLEFEVKKRRLSAILDIILSDAKHVSDEECIELGNMIKKKRLKQLKKMGVV